MKEAARRIALLSSVVAALGCGAETESAYGDNPAQAGGDTDSSSEAETDTEPAGPPLDWDEDGWTPQGKWGADGDMDDGGPQPYKSHVWECLICSNRRGPDSIPAADRTVIAPAALLEMVGKLPQPPQPPPEEDADPTVLYLSADDSNSQSSAAVLRDMILNGSIVPAGKVRIWELLNYAGFSYSPPTGKALRIEPQLRPYDFDEGIYALQIGLQGRMIDDTRRPLNVTFSLDTSGSMSGSPIALLKETCAAIASSLREGDRVSMVDWSTSQNVALDSLEIQGADDPDLLDAIWQLGASGGTDLHSGLVAAYQLANDNFIEGGMNRVVLISDGGANVGVTDADLIAEEAAGGEADAIYMVGAGVGDTYSGTWGYNDELMDTVTDLGKGAAVFVDSQSEAHRLFEERFLANMEMVAHDVQVELTLPPHFEMYEFFGEEYSEEADEVEPQHLAPNDAMVFQQLIKTSQPDQVMADYEVGIHVTWTDALSGQPDEAQGSWKLQELVDAPADELRKGDAVVVYGQTFGRVYERHNAQDHDGAMLECQWGRSVVEEAAEELADAELLEMALLLDYYCSTVVASYL